MSEFDEKAYRDAESRIKAALSGKGAALQGALLADMVALWLAGHIVTDDEAASAAAREMILRDWLDTVWKLVPLAEAEIIKPRLRDGRRS
jgi:hypothetical protein